MSRRLAALCGLLLLAAPAATLGEPAPNLTPGQLALNGDWQMEDAKAILAAAIAGQKLPAAFTHGLFEMDRIAAPKLQPWARAFYDKNRASEAAGQFVASPWTECYPSLMVGEEVPVGAAYGMNLLIEPGTVTFLAETNRSIRIVHMNQDHPAGLKPSWQGHSVGHWEGDTLVIDTVGFNDKNNLHFGGPVTPKMHIVERLRIVNGQLEDQITYDDPGAYTGPFSVTERLEHGGPFQEYICAENNHEGGVPTASGKPTPFTIPKAGAN